MPTMGKPVSLSEQRYTQISMGPTKSGNTKAEILKKITGVDPSARKFVNKKDHNKLGKNEFLKMLMQQLQSQDPLKPMDQKQFAADLAQFTQLEQMANMRIELEKGNNNIGAENKFYAASFLGKRAMTNGTTLTLKDDGENVDIPFSLDQPAKKLMIRIFDEKNNLISQIEKENISKGFRQISWNGTSLDLTPAIKGTYTVEVRAWNDKLEPFTGETKSFGQVTGVSFVDGETVLKLDGQKSVFLRDVDSFDIMKHNNNKETGTSKQFAKQAVETYRNSQ